MANETELANIGHATDEVSDGVSAALVNNVVLLPIIYSENLPVDSNVKLFRKKGSIAATIIAESAGGTTAEYTETEITATAAKHAATARYTVEAQQFSRVTNEMLMQELGAGIARDMEDEITALFTGFSQSKDAGTTMDTDTIMECIASVFINNAGMGMQLVGALGYGQITDLRKQLLTSGAGVFAQPNQTTLLMGAQPNGYAGQLPGIDLYQITCPTSGGNDVGLVFNPMIAFGSMMSESVQTRARWVGQTSNLADSSAAYDGYFDELSAFAFFDVVEWNDLAGCQALSDT